MPSTRNREEEAQRIRETKLFYFPIDDDIVKKKHKRRKRRAQVFGTSVRFVSKENIKST